MYTHKYPNNPIKCPYCLAPLDVNVAAMGHTISTNQYDEPAEVASDCCGRLLVYNAISYRKHSWQDTSSYKTVRASLTKRDTDMFGHPVVESTKSDIKINVEQRFTTGDFIISRYRGPHA